MSNKKYGCISTMVSFFIAAFITTSMMKPIISREWAAIHDSKLQDFVKGNPTVTVVYVAYEGKCQMLILEGGTGDRARIYFRNPTAFEEVTHDEETQFFVVGDSCALTFSNGKICPRITK